MAECHPYACLERLPHHLRARDTGSALLRCVLDPGPAAVGVL